MFGFPNLEKPVGFKYKNNFLKTVIFQIKFAQSRQISESKDYFDEILLNDFPNVKNVIKGQIHLKIDKTPVIVSENNTTDGFEYRSKNGNKIFSVTADTVSYTILGNEYKSFESEFNHFNKNFEAIMHNFDIKLLTRVAIRKINLFEFQTDDKNAPLDFLSVIFKEQFVNSMFSFPDKNHISTGLMKYDFNEDPYQLKLSYGLTPPQQPTLNNIVSLDIDLFNNKKPIDLNDFSNNMRFINQTIYNIFDYMITDNLKSIMDSERQ